MSVTTRVLPVANYPAGAHTIPSTALADDVTHVGIAVLRCTSADPTIWPSVTAIIAFDFQVSLDNGATWRQWFNGSDRGGIVVSNKTGFEAQLMSIDQDIPAGTNRRVRGTVTLTESVRTACDITVT